jgi:long-chain acyl-CoA synthetase
MILFPNTRQLINRGVYKSDSTKNSIIDFVKKNAAPYKVPKKIVFMDELPTSSVGKILKRELREMLKS